MKKLIVVFFLALPVCLAAQRFSGGLVGGLNVSQIEGDADGGYRKAGLLGGAFVKTHFRENWGGLMEIRYSEKGSLVRLDEYTNRIFRLQYIEMPIMATFDVIEKLQAQAGVSIGYLFKQSQRQGGISDVIDDFNPYEVAASLGIDYQLLEHLSANLRLSFSMIPIQTDHPGATSTQELEAAYNNVLSFGLYYRIGR